MRNQLQEDLTHGLQAALGCSDPGVIAYTAALAAQFQTKELIKDITLRISPGLFKNAAIVSIPHVQAHGVIAACSCGIFLSPEKKLMVLEDMNDEIATQAKAITPKIKLEIDDTQTQLFVEVTINGDHHSLACVSQRYSHIHKLSCDGVSFIDQEELPQEMITYGIEDVLQWYLHEETDFTLIQDAIRLNTALIGYAHAQYALVYQAQETIDDKLQYALISAIEARMQGAPYPVMSNSGSGNQGIMATVPVYVMAKQFGVSTQTMYRACALSNAITIYIKKSFGEMSALCGACTAGIGVAAALTYLQNGTKEQMKNAMINTIANITGILCDGAKSSCALKMSSGLHAAIQASSLALANQVIPNEEGILAYDLASSIQNLVQVAHASSQLDHSIQAILLHKQSLR